MRSYRNWAKATGQGNRDVDGHVMVSESTMEQQKVVVDNAYTDRLCRRAVQVLYDRHEEAGMSEDELRAPGIGGEGEEEDEEEDEGEDGGEDETKDEGRSEGEDMDYEDCGERFRLALDLAIEASMQARNKYCTAVDDDPELTERFLAETSVEEWNRALSATEVREPRALEPIDFTPNNIAPVEVSTVFTCRDFQAQEFERILEDKGIAGLAQSCFLNLRGHNTIGNLPGAFLFEVAMKILSSTDIDIITALIHGTLVLRAHTDRDFAKRLRTLRDRSLSQPSCYSQFLVDKGGISPSIKVLCQALEDMLYYISEDARYRDDGHAYRIDTVVRDASGWAQRFNSEGRRRYLETDDGHTVQAKSQRILTFIFGLLTRLESAHGGNVEDSIRAPIVECGYTSCAPRRFTEHSRHHHSSNTIMNLLHAVLEVRHPGQYKFEQYVIYLIWEPEQASMAEILFTLLQQGYIYNGGGCSHARAGESNSRALKECALNYTKFEAAALSESPLRRNMEEAYKLLQHELSLKVLEGAPEGMDDVSSDESCANDIQHMHDNLSDAIAAAQSTFEKINRFLTALNGGA